MMKNILLIIGLLAYAIISPGFECGRGRPPYDCPEYTTDTVKIAYNILNNRALAVFDTISFSSLMTDTFTSVKGAHVNSTINNMQSHLQVYKVVSYGSGFGLNYANIEFNPLVTEGYLQNSPNQGISYLYNRVEPANKLNASLVAGAPGLYLVSVAFSSSYYSLYFYDNTNRCSQYFGVPFIPVVDQQRQYWDSLGTTSLRLIGSIDNQPVSNKQDNNYFFVKVNL